MRGFAREDSFSHKIHGTGISTCINGWFYGTCRYICHTWILLVWKLLSSRSMLIFGGVSSMTPQCKKKASRAVTRPFCSAIEKFLRPLRKQCEVWSLSTVWWDGNPSLWNFKKFQKNRSKTLFAAWNQQCSGRFDWGCYQIQLQFGALEATHKEHWTMECWLHPEYVGKNHLSHGLCHVF